MGTEEIIGLAVAFVVMLAGSVAGLIPGVPGAPIVLLTAVLHRLYFHGSSVNNWVLAGLAILTIVSLVFDYFAGLAGAKKLGATWWGIVGATIGGLIGIFFGLPGIIAGPFLGAMIFEMIGGYKIQPAARAGAGVVLGMVVGAMGRFAICIFMTAMFVGDVILRSTRH